MNSRQCYMAKVGLLNLVGKEAGPPAYHHIPAMTLLPRKKTNFLAANKELSMI